VIGAGREDPSLHARVVERRPLTGVRAGSALLSVGERLLAVQDDAWSVAWIDVRSGAITLVPLLGDGAPLPKSSKPDFELAFATHDGGVCLLGSGSLPTRCSMVRASADLRELAIRDVPELYATVRRALALAGRPNLEAAVATGGQLRVFHRGAGNGQSARVDLLVSRDYAVQGVLGVVWFDLGYLHDVPLNVTDAVAMSGARTAFLAVAERTQDAVADGPVSGSVIGVLDGARDATAVGWTRIVDTNGEPTRCKFEGLVVDANLCGAWLLSDSDSPAQAAELCRVALDGFDR
jgi:hypothetical protein